MGVKLLVIPFLFDKFLVCTLLQNSAFIEYDDHIGILCWGDPVAYDERGPVAWSLFQIVQDGFEFLGTSSNDWNYIADKDKYRKNVMEMIKKGMDDLFADFDAVVADQS